MLTPAENDGCPSLRKSVVSVLQGWFDCEELALVSRVSGVVFQYLFGGAVIWTSGGRGRSGEGLLIYFPLCWVELLVAAVLQIHFFLVRSN